MLFSNLLLSLLPFGPPSAGRRPAHRWHARRPATGPNAYARRAYRPRLECLEDRLTPSTLTVTSPLDDGSTGTLRAVIAAASNGDTITFDAGLSGSTIKLDPVQGELLLNKDLAITGPGAAALAISGQNRVRVFEIAAGATDTISGLTVANGNITSPYYPNDVGGGILVGGTLTVDGCTLSGNYAAGGGAIYNAGTLAVSDSTLGGNSGNSGGGIYNVGTLTVSDSALTGNSVSGYGRGGAIGNDGTMTVSACTLSGNWAPYGGSGILNEVNGTMTLNNGTSVTNNAAKYLAGGILNEGAMAISGSTVSGNHTTDDYTNGGGIVNGGTMTINDSSVSDNHSTSHGGGIDNEGGTLTVTGSTLAGNSAAVSGPLYGPIGAGGGIYNVRGTVTVSDSALDGNSAYEGDAICNGYYTDGPVWGGTLLVSACTFSGNNHFSYYGPAGTAITNTGTATVNNSSIVSQDVGISNNPSATLTVSGSTLSGTGGIGINNRGTLTVSGSSLSGNSYCGLYNTGDATVSDSSSISGNTGTGIINEPTYGQGNLSGQGNLTVTGSAVSNNAGGGIVNGGTVTVSDSSTISGNSIGGGIVNGSRGTVTVSGSTVSGNNAANGGGIFNSGTLTITAGSSIAGNSATSGGGIANWGGTVTITAGSSIAGNSATSGGGVYNAGGFGGSQGTLTLSNSTLCNNSATYGGSIDNGVNPYDPTGTATATVSHSTLLGNTAADGAGIDNSGGDTVIITDSSTISGNSATDKGGGIYNGTGPGAGMLSILNSTDCGNTAPVGADLFNSGTVTVTNSDVCVVAVTTVTTVTSSVSPSVFAQAVTFTATVVGGWTGAPTGTVTFLLDGSTPLGTVVLNDAGQATFTTAAIPVGDHTVTAVYSGGSTTGDAGSTTFLASASLGIGQSVLSAQQELGLIVDQVDALVTAGLLDSGTGNALLVKLNNAIASLNSGNTTAGVNQLDAFINQANAMLRTGKLDNTDAITLIGEIDLAIAAALDSAT